MESDSTRTIDPFRIFLALRTALHMRREDILAARMEDGGGDERFRRQFAMVDHAAVKVSFPAGNELDRATRPTRRPGSKILTCP